MKNTKIKDLMTRDTIKMDIKDTVDKIAFVMKDKEVGSVFIFEDNNLIGLITKTDLLERVLVDCLNPCEVIAGDIVTRNLITISKDTLIPDCLKLMYQHKIKRLPVINDNNGELIGIITSYDIIAAFNTLELS